MVFRNKFFSLAGQKERLTNVKDVLSIAINPFSKDRVKANVKNRTGKAALEFVANNPFTTAGLATPIGLTGKSIAASGLKATAGKVATRIGALPTKTKIIAGTIGIGAGSAALSAPKDQVIKVASGLTPESFAKAGKDVGSIRSRGNIIDVIKRNPVIAGAAGVAGAAVIGRAALPSVVGAIQTQRQISATKDLAKSISQPAEVAANVPKDAVPIGPITGPSSNPLQNAAAGEEPTKRPRRTRTKRKASQSINLKNEVNIGNFIKNKTLRSKNGNSKRTKRTKR